MPCHLTKIGGPLMGYKKEAPARQLGRGFSGTVGRAARSTFSSSEHHLQIAAAGAKYA